MFIEVLIDTPTGAKAINLNQVAVVLESGNDTRLIMSYGGDVIVCMDYHEFMKLVDDAGLLS